jgi:acetoin utilization protein AcuB
VHKDSVKAVEQLLKESTTCENWMTPRLYTVTPADSFDHARKLLKSKRINQLPVVGSGKMLLGIVTDRDLRDAVLPGFEDCRIESVMSSPAITLARHSTLVNAAEVLRMSRIGSVPIVDGNSLVGIITRSDILEAFVAFANGRYRPSRPRNRFRKRAARQPKLSKR